MSGQCVERPNGKLYRPRKGLRMIGFTDEVDGSDYVAVMGTHDAEAARAAFPSGGYFHRYLVDDRPGWVRETIRHGERFIDCWDCERGAAAVIFRESDDAPAVSGVAGNPEEAGEK